MADRYGDEFIDPFFNAIYDEQGNIISIATPPSPRSRRRNNRPSRPVPRPVPRPSLPVSAPSVAFLDDRKPAARPDPPQDNRKPAARPTLSSATASSSDSYNDDDEVQVLKVVSPEEARRDRHSSHSSPVARRRPKEEVIELDDEDDDEKTVQVPNDNDDDVSAIKPRVILDECNACGQSLLRCHMNRFGKFVEIEVKKHIEDDGPSVSYASIYEEFIKAYSFAVNAAYREDHGRNPTSRHEVHHPPACMWASSYLRAFMHFRKIIKYRALSKAEDEVEKNEKRIARRNKKRNRDDDDDDNYTVEEV